MFLGLWKFCLSAKPHLICSHIHKVGVVAVEWTGEEGGEIGGRQNAALCCSAKEEHGLELLIPGDLSSRGHLSSICSTPGVNGCGMRRNLCGTCRPLTPCKRTADPERSSLLEVREDSFWWA